MRLKEKLAEALDSGELVRYCRRRFDDVDTKGYVIGNGPNFVLFLIIDDRVRHDGFQAVRIEDITTLRIPDKYQAFVEKALEIRGDVRPQAPQIDLTSVESILRTANKEFPLVTVHREEIEPDVCQIGQVVSLDDGKVELKELDPHAIWDTEHMTYETVDITRIDFGGGYEEALALVADAD